MHTLSKFPNLVIIISSFFWGTYWIPLRQLNIGGSESVWPILASFFILCLLLIKPIFWLINRIPKEKNNYFFLGNFFSASAIALYSESLIRGEIAEVIILFYLCPVWGTVLAKIILKKNFNIKRYVSLILGIIGLEVILGIDKGIIMPTTISSWMALIGGFAWALGMTFFHLAETTRAIEKTALTGLLLPFLFLLLTLIPGGRETEFNSLIFIDNYTYIWIFIFSIVWLLPSMLLTFSSAEILDPGRINILLMFEIIIGITSAALLTEEIIGIREVIGATLIIIAGSIDLIKFKS
ncbi:MAG: hypothetical protein CFH21_01082 [Alphaproteobacteria bacterium MarineAlpha5_Bin11]|nr:hypothetical protein [Pelagibacteraceae bacterium]PPR42548.1 MAG: hypothetical protein CFH21_01082 [Alphaproteobacteria bacterium MarineAlpha5_Bin11]PPR51476.1 MAG: hypothetical protein CFH20_00541 [Alphaproteobacteria bacterium MarineAlpha5_Bin10]|tara:strand:+ start:893 stop:1777 length:885 start_codon:yes stop_codon:yes gene_type:complete